MSQQADPEILQAFGGEYSDSAIGQYVSGIGSKLAATVERTDITYKFTVLNTPIVNALATPGGYIYITRGLLALADSEAELAGVLGHELGHVNARHQAQRQSREALGQLGLLAVGIAGAATGTGPLARNTQMVALGYLRAFSRDEEFEADTLGVRYLSRAGYDPSAMASFLLKLQSHTRLEAQIAGQPAGSDNTDYLSTHPSTAERYRAAMAAARIAPVANPIVGADNYLDTINGLLYGESPEEGFVRGRLYVHPVLRFRFEVPQGYRLFDTPDRVFAEGPGGSGMVFDMDKGPWSASMSDYLTKNWTPGVKLSSAQALEINGLEAATSSVRLGSPRGPVDMFIAAIRVSTTQIYRFRFISMPDQTSALSPGFNTSIKSFKSLTAAEAATFKPYRIRIVIVKQNDTMRTLAARMVYSDFQLQRLAVLNGLLEVQKLKPGQRIKIITE